MTAQTRERAPWRDRLHVIIFEHDTAGGKAFDVALLLAIAGSVFTVMLASVESLEAYHGPWLHGLEWAFTGLFAVEYALRLATARRPVRYATSFYGIIDLAAVLPTFVSLIIPGAQSLLTIRALRLLRAFRVLKLVGFLDEARALGSALRASLRKITVFLGVVVTIVVIMGSLMYVVEGAENGFTSIPRSVYWAIVTMTTVGYGDIAPSTVPGQIIASVVMILGYGIIAVPTGIVTAEMTQFARRARACPRCSTARHTGDARYCRSCGHELPIAD